MVPADSGRIPRVPPYSGARLACPWLPVRGCHPLRPAFPDGSGSHRQSLWPVLLPRARLDAPGLGSSRFARHYSGNRCFFLLLRVLRCFSSPGSPTPIRVWRAFSPPGCPIRTCADHFMLADPRAFSQLAASFLAAGSPGIPRPPFVTCSRVTSTFVSPS